MAEVGATNIMDRLNIVKSVGIECIEESELDNLLATVEHPVCYDGFEPSSRLHIAQGILKVINFNKLVSSGIKCQIWIADYFAWLNDKMGGDLEMIKKAGQYMIHVWRAAGISDNVEFLFASEEIGKRSDEYWRLVMDISRQTTINRMIRCCQIMGRKESSEMSAAQILYPAMQAADIFFLKADICQLGLDQRKVNVLAREYAGSTGRKKPVVLSHQMLPGLGEGQEKMAKSDPSGAIFMDDDPATIKSKIKHAYCPPEIVEANPCVSYVKALIFPWFSKFVVNRPKKFGGDVVYNNSHEFETAYVAGMLHPCDLKDALTKRLIEILKPVQDYLAADDEAKTLKTVLSAYLANLQAS